MTVVFLTIRSLYYMDTDLRDFVVYLKIINQLDVFEIADGRPVLAKTDSSIDPFAMSPNSFLDNFRNRMRTSEWQTTNAFEYIGCMCADRVQTTQRNTLAGVKRYIFTEQENARQLCSWFDRTQNPRQNGLMQIFFPVAGLLRIGR